jgi:tetratricopeptide (TPR) repeat protein
MHESLSSALALHQAGNLPAAAQQYQQILQRQADNADALHLLGVLRHQQGDHARAVELIGKAVALRPNVAAWHANLAEGYRALGQLERAVGCCRMALRLWPEFPEALCNLGLALQGQGKHAEAVEYFRRALALAPEFAAAHSNLGNALRELGQVDEALEHFRRAVAIAPDYAPARTNLGQMLVDRGKAEEALPHCQEAVRLQPDLAAVHHNLGNAFRGLERFAEARAAYLEAIRLDPNLARSHAHLGLVLQQEGQLGDALTWLTQAVELAPNEPDFWQYLAELHGDREDSAAAIPCWERVLGLAPDRASAHNGLGWALQEEGRFPEAEEHYRAALRLEPDFGGALLSLGGLQEELGEMAAAEASFREAIQHRPRFALPYARLATLLRGGLGDADLAAVEQWLADPELSEGPRARLLFGLAHVLDARGDWSRAADCLRQANTLSLELARRQKREYMSAEHDQFVDRLLQEFTADWFTRLAGAGLPTRRPVFVFGLPRSGTTLIEQILASHSRVHGAGELRLARTSFESIPTVLGQSARPMDGVASLTSSGLQRLAREHEAKLAAHDVSAERVVDKMPDNYLYLGMLAAMFPQATLIHCRRDVRDVALSCWMTDFRSIRWANDPAHLAARCRQYQRLMQHWRTVLPDRLCEVDYEETVSALEPVAQRLIAACGLEWEPACLEFHRTKRPVRTASVIQVRQPVYSRSVARWRHYEQTIADLFAGLP